LIGGRSISSRLTIWYSTVFFAGLVLFSAVMWLDLEHTLMTGRSRTLERRADRLGDLLRDIRQDPPLERVSKFEAFAEATGGGLIQVLRADGTRALPSPRAAEGFPWPTFAPGVGEQFRDVGVSGQQYLVLIRPLSPGSDPLVLYVAAPLEGNRPILRAFSAGLLWTIPAVLALSALGGYVISRRALKPVDQITAATRSISLSSLSERLPVPDTRDELQRLSETCNAMLDRLETAVNEIKRFTADASHELRNPWSFVRTLAEVSLRSSQADPASRKAFEEIVEESGKAKRLLEDMLILARADAGNAQLAFEPVNLAELVTAVCEKARLLATTRQHTLALSLEGECRRPVWADYASLRRLMWILLDNAAKYTQAPGSIRVTVKNVADEVLVSVEDNGCGIPSADLPRIFERFYRTDPSRSQVEGTGLGLAIAKWIADAHHARLTVESNESTGSAFQIAFPVLVETPSQPRLSKYPKARNHIVIPELQ
jgi:heavy metal sensor kinase